MSKYLVDSTTLTQIADAIRSKTGETSHIFVPDMADKISSITSGGGIVGAWVFQNVYDGADSYIEISEGLLKASGDPWYVMDAQRTEYHDFFKDQPLELSVLDTTKHYQVFGMGGYVAADLVYTNVQEEQVRDNKLRLATDGYIAFLEEGDLTGAKIIRPYAFYNCEMLQRAYIPSSVMSIGYGAFQYCASLKEIHMNSPTPPWLDTSVFDNCPNLTSIFVPNGSAKSYASHSNWSDYYRYIFERGNSWVLRDFASSYDEDSYFIVDNKLYTTGEPSCVVDFRGNQVGNEFSGGDGAFVDFSLLDKSQTYSVINLIGGYTAATLHFVE